MIFLIFQEGLDLINCEEWWFEFGIEGKDKKFFKELVIFFVDVKLILVSNDSFDHLFWVFLLLDSLLISDHVVCKYDRALDFFLGRWFQALECNELFGLGALNEDSEEVQFSSFVVSLEIETL